MVTLGITVAIAVHLTVKSVLPEVHYHFSFKSVYAILVAKHLKEEWLTVLQQEF